MAKEGRKAATDGKREITLDILNTWYEYAESIMRRKFWEYFVIDQFLRGNHNVRGNPQDNTLELTKKSDAISFPINKIYTTFRAVRGFVTRHKPVVEVEPKSTTDPAKEYARRANKILERDNQLNNFRRLNKEWVYYGVKYGVGWRQIGFDQEKHVAIRWTIDPNDLVIGAQDGNYQDAPYIIKSVKRTVAYIKHKYPDAQGIAADAEVATNVYKALAMQISVLTGNQTKQTSEEDTLIVRECWYRMLDKNSKGGYINKCTFTDTQILDKEETPYEEYPFIPYYAEVAPNELAPDGHLKHVIAPQRLLNLLNTQMVEYNHIVNRGRILKPKNAGFRVIYAKEGQIIEYNPGKKPEVLNPPVVSSMLDRQLGLSQQWIEDIGGQHDASLGATPERLSSGRAIEQIQMGDSNNISDLRDNFEDALASEAAWILRMYSYFEKDAILMDEQVDKKAQEFAAVGKVAYERSGKEVPKKTYMEDNGAYYDTFAVLPDNDVKVSVTSQLGETRQARLDLLMKLVELQVISPKTFLEHLEFPNTSDILERLAEEELAGIALEQMKTMGQQPPGGAPVTNAQGEEVLPTPPTNGETENELLSIKNRAQQLLGPQ